MPNQYNAAANDFWSNVDKSHADGCWLWTGCMARSGYGRIHINRRDFRAHRVAYEKAVGPIPEGLILLHSCDNRRCVNPAHLIPGTRLENNQDRDAKGRAAAGKRNGRSKLTESEIAEIRSAHASGQSMRSIGKRFNVSGNNVAKICDGRTWRTVSSPDHNRMEVRHGIL